MRKTDVMAFREVSWLPKTLRQQFSGVLWMLAAHTDKGDGKKFVIADTLAKKHILSRYTFWRGGGKRTLVSVQDHK